MSPSARVAFRSCRLPLVSPSARVAFRSIKTLSFLCALVLLPLPTWAGGWLITFNGSTTSSNSSVPSYTIKNSQVIPDPQTHRTDGVNFSSRVNGAGIGTYSVAPGSYTLSVTATLTWQAQNAQDMPPPAIDVLESAYAGTSAYAPNPVGLSVKAMDGLGDSPTPTQTTNPPYQGSISTGKHLVHLSVSGGSVTLQVRSLSQSVSATSGIGPPFSGSLSYAVVIDTRSVTLSRDGARSLGIVYSPDHQQHGEYVDSSGVAHGETTYSYISASAIGTPPPVLVPNWQIFHPAFSGAWTQKTVYNSLGQSIGTAPDVNWSWSPNESEDTWNMGKCKMPTSKITYVDNGTRTGKSAGPAPYPVTYTATDTSDGATATATYQLMVHDQWDNLRLDPAHPFDVIDNDVLVVVGGHQITQENDASSTSAPVGPLSITFTVNATLTAQLNGSFKLADFFTLGGSFQAAASVSGTIGEQITGPPIPPKSYIQLYFHTHYHKNHWLVDHYTASGYDSTYTELIDSTPDIAELHWGHSNSLPF